MFGGGAITWKSKKQDCVVQSTMEAEYVSMNLATREAVYLRKFLRSLLVVDCVERPIPLFCDNESVIAITRDLKCHSKAKHIEGKYHYIRDILRKGEVVILKISSKDNLANPLNKCLPVTNFNVYVGNMVLFSL
ncbi:hypothetical protein H6P81_013881 [Aristolochia fimbriata]|uniref:Retrovirus-related Pol polyprotein from transposon TNT 1-94 n=1 Tax=Aristolochia fimbriata TaxID=158543 RepID=A0AAV7EKK8_ARIFI|nr:hypothetical protein H6P81_013881 [Aristolochia fimbriata]